MERGSVSYKVYLYYLEAITYPVACIVFFFILCQSAIRIGTNFWLSAWSESNLNSTTNVSSPHYPNSSLHNDLCQQNFSLLSNAHSVYSDTSKAQVPCHLLQHCMPFTQFLINYYCNSACLLLNSWPIIISTVHVRAVSTTCAVVYTHEKVFTRVIISRPGTQTCELSLKSLHKNVCILCLHAQCVSVCGVWNRFLCMWQDAVFITW